MCELDGQQYWELMDKTVKDLARLQITIDRITEANDFLPDYIIVPNDWPLTADKTLWGIPILRSDVPDLVAGYKAVPDPLPGPYRDVQAPVTDTCTRCGASLEWKPDRQGHTTWVGTNKGYEGTTKCGSRDDLRLGRHRPTRWAQASPHIQVESTNGIEPNNGGEGRGNG